MTPFSQYKGWMAEGGIRNALVVSGPINKLPKGSINHGTMFVADIMPTLLEVAGTKYPETLRERRHPNYREILASCTERTSRFSTNG